MHRFLTRLSEPDALSFIITALLVLSIPLVLHFFIYRSSKSTYLPCFLLIGPSGSGKTSLLTLFERGAPADTRTSQVPLTTECSLPVNSVAASSRYRSVNDPSNEAHKKFLLIDTPGHGKLRHYATESIVNPQNVVGIIFLIDSAEMSRESVQSVQDTQLQQTAELLHDTLFLLQSRHTSGKRSGAMPVLVAANKQDLFTALPAPLVKTTLEKEIAKIRASRSRGLLDSGVGMNDVGEEKEMLGDTSSDKFSFSQMEEFDIQVQVLGGSVATSDAPDVHQWWNWIGEQL